MLKQHELNMGMFEKDYMSERILKVLAFSSMMHRKPLQVYLENDFLYGTGYCVFKTRFWF